MSTATQWAAILATLAVLWFGFVTAQPWQRRWPRSPVAIVVTAGRALLTVVAWAVIAAIALTLIYDAARPLIGPPAATLLGAVPAVIAGLLLIRRRRKRRMPRAR